MMRPRICPNSTSLSRESTVRLLFTVVGAVLIVTTVVPLLSTSVLKASTIVVNLSTTFKAAGLMGNRVSVGESAAACFPSTRVFRPTQLCRGAPFSHKRGPDFLLAALATTRMRLSPKESRMNLLNVTNLDRKSGIRGPKTTFFECSYLIAPCP